MSQHKNLRRRGVPLDDEGNPLYPEEFDSRLVRGLRGARNVAVDKANDPEHEEKKRRWRFMDLFKSNKEN